MRVGLDVVEQFDPRRRSDGEVQEALDDVELGHERRLMGQQVFADFLRRLLGSLLRHAEEGEHNQRQMSFKFFLGFLQLHLCGRHVLSVECFQSADDGRYQFLLYIHSF